MKYPYVNIHSFSYSNAIFCSLVFFSVLFYLLYVSDSIMLMSFLLVSPLVSFSLLGLALASHVCTSVVRDIAVIENGLLFS